MTQWCLQISLMISSFIPTSQSVFSLIGTGSSRWRGSPVPVLPAEWTTGVYVLKCILFLHFCQNLQTLTHIPSHSRTSRLLFTSLSLGYPFPRIIFRVRDVTRVNVLRKYATPREHQSLQPSLRFSKGRLEDYLTSGSIHGILHHKRPHVLPTMVCHLPLY